jgi:hypothetical protein
MRREELPDIDPQAVETVRSFVVEDGSMAGHLPLEYHRCAGGGRRKIRGSFEVLADLRGKRPIRPRVCSSLEISFALGGRLLLFSTESPKNR